MINFFSTRMQHLATLVAATATIGLAVPAQAQDEQRANERSNVSAPTTGGQSARSSERRICVEQRFTGSRVPRRTCLTAAEWQATEGFVPGRE